MGDEADFLDEIRKEISLVNKDDSLSGEIDLHLSSDHEIESKLDRNEISLMKEQKVEPLLTNKDNKRICAVIPCFNEEATIGSVVLKAKRYVDEVVVIDDGSTDKTAKIAKYAGATVLRHGENKGYGAALKSGFKYARENEIDVLTVLDGDGQHDADQIQTVMKPVSEGKADISVGSRFLDSTGNMVPMYRRFGIAVLTRFTNAGSDKGNRVTDGQSGFRAYSRKAIESIDPKDTQMGASSEILLQGRKQHLTYEEVPITCSYEGDCSTERPVGHGLGVIVSILKYLEVEHSLLFFGVPGFVMFVIGLLSGFNVYLSYKDGGFIPFGPALMTVLLLIIGMLSGMTGLILHAVINANKRI
jgi:glycosyltransferase involved in cell wall biosynthesis